MKADPRAIKKAICDSVQLAEIQEQAVRIDTPFLDWKGVPFQFYVDSHGIVTDGGGVLNEMRALSLDQAYLDWPFREDFLSQYGIVEREGEFVCESQEPSAVVRYAQGLSRLASHFEVKVSAQENDQFIREVRNQVRPVLVRKINASVEGRQQVAQARLARRTISIRSYRQKLDFSPVDERIWIQVIGRERGTPPTKAEHVNAKFLSHFLGREEKVKHYFVAVVPSLKGYPSESVKLIKEKTDKYVAFRDDPTALDSLADLLLQPTDALSSFQ